MENKQKDLVEIEVVNINESSETKPELPVVTFILGESTCLRCQ